MLALTVLAMAERPKGDPEAGLGAALKSGLPVIVKLGADWCPPCREMKPVLKELARELKGKAIILDLDINEHRALARKLKVKLIPTTIFYDRYGKDKAVRTGFMDRKELLKTINELKLFD